MPISYNLSKVSGRKWFLAPNGSDSAAGTERAPLRTLARAVKKAQPGESIIVRGGIYPISDSQYTAVDRNGVSILAYPGEVPVFDGSVPAPRTVKSDGDRRYFSYQPMPAELGEGVSWRNLPKATFTDAGNPTGLAAERGWRCVSSSSYRVPTPSQQDPRGCGSLPAHVITGFYPDQVWVDGKALTQVLSKNLVVKGTFYLARSSTTDRAPAKTSLYLHKDDAGNMPKVRVSSSNDYFLVIRGRDVRIEGIVIRRHSAAWNKYTVLGASATRGFTLRNVKLEDNSSISLKVAGGSNSGGTRLVRDTTLDKLTVTGSGWSASVLTYTDDTTFTNSELIRSNSDGEFSGAPQLGGIKATKNDRLRVENLNIRDNVGPGLWMDQSNYDVEVANSHITNNSETALFFEISHGLSLVNNYIVNPGDSSTLRLAGSSGIKLVNNTIVGGADVIGVYTDARSKNYGSNRPCSEHSARYRQGGDHWRDCNVGSTSDFDRARPGAYGGGSNLTPGMKWKPKIDLMVNNIIANPSGKGNCGKKVTLCAISYLAWNGVNASVEANSIFHKKSIIDGNLYQTGGALVKMHTASGQRGTFTADTLRELKNSAGFGASYYGLDVESHGKNADVGTWVGSDGKPKPKLDSIHGDAASSPNDPAVTKYVPAGTKHYGALIPR